MPWPLSGRGFFVPGAAIYGALSAAAARYRQAAAHGQETTPAAYRSAAIYAKNSQIVRKFHQLSSRWSDQWKTGQKTGQKMIKKLIAFFMGSDLRKNERA